MRKIAILPTLLTLGNGICGFAAIACASKIYPDGGAANDLWFARSGWLILAAMVFDMLDGHVARLSRTASKFGGELDSLCDAVSFGVAPAFLLLKMGPGWEPRPMLHQLVAGIATLYMVCAILRLARFNVENTPDPASHKRFRGLPSPGAAGCLASLAILRGGLPHSLSLLWPDLDQEAIHLAVQRFVEGFSPAGALVIALLMVSVVPYPHLTKNLLRGKQHVTHVVQILLAAFLVIMFCEPILVAAFWGYALILPLRHTLLRQLRAKQIPAPRLDDPLPR